MRKKKKITSRKAEAFVYDNLTSARSDGDKRMAIVVAGSSGFPCALVSFIEIHAGEYKKHTVRPFLQQTLGMKRAEHFVETGEICGECGE
jgi:hypothetical protein